MRLRALALGCSFATLATFAALPIQADDAPPPAILTIEVAPSPVLGGGTATAIVCTSPDVTDVEARIGIMRIPIPRVAPGRFELVRDVPHIPRFFRRTYEVTFVASNGDDATRTALNVDVR